jgi:hypothetical protein
MKTKRELKKVENENKDSTMSLLEDVLDRFSVSGKPPPTLVATAMPDGTVKYSFVGMSVNDAGMLAFKIMQWTSTL